MVNRLCLYVLALIFGIPLLGQSAQGESLQVVMMIGEREYETNRTLPEFAKRELEPLGVQVTVVNHDPDNPNHFPGLEALKQADVLVLSVRRRTLSAAQMGLIRDHFEAGKGLVAIRTASHAFSLRKKQPAQGYVQWLNFDQEVLGHSYQGHYSNKEGTGVRVEESDAALLQGVKKEALQSGGTLYIARDVSPDSTVLMTGFAKEKGEDVSEPVALCRTWKKSRGFYTSLGHPSDFEQEQFRRLLRNAVVWAAEKAGSTSGD